MIGLVMFEFSRFMKTDNYRVEGRWHLLIRPFDVAGHNPWRKTGIVFDSNASFWAFTARCERRITRKEVRRMQIRSHGLSVSVWDETIHSIRRYVDYGH